MNRIEELLQFLKDSPNDPFLKYALTMEYRKMGDTDKTREGFLDLITQHEDYVGTYYHFAKFLEGQRETEQALRIYEKGMDVAQRMRNRHAYGELQSAYKQALGEDEDDWDD
ncbi:tetratricopeptide repeat protein [Sphingobacterium wenxiniae]|uniref:Uncharacterized protein n=1 Tax=Sphingobacterium wenxiniae TaxID=683125 RepID=A0A1I6VEL0_9SPHI|nr:hypothetical protein [Sphingobacterium wenxiniae]SFT12105.1 hypothetical protein SAMN05660206_11341 [Sphingobacterium wenxiniae]